MAKGIFARSSTTSKMARCEAVYSDWWHDITDWWQRPKGRVATRACEWGQFRKRRFGAICEAGHKVRPTCQTDHQSCLIGKYAFWVLNTVRRIWLFLCRYFEKNWLSKIAVCYISRPISKSGSHLCVLCHRREMCLSATVVCAYLCQDESWVCLWYTVKYNCGFGCSLKYLQLVYCACEYGCTIRTCHVVTGYVNGMPHILALKPLAS